jgi:hypothetical protein
VGVTAGGASARELRCDLHPEGVDALGHPVDVQVGELTAPRPLDAPQRKILAEALRRAEETRDVIEDALVSFGRWVLVKVFDDAAAALDGRHDNPVWRDLLARAGGPTLRLSARMLYVALHIAAHDKRITDEAWRNLEPGRNELLLPLGDESAMRRAAQHVTAMKLTQRATRAYVASLRAEQGEAHKARLTPARLTAQVRGFRERVANAAWQRRALSVAMKAEPDARDAVTTAVHRLASHSMPVERTRIRPSPPPPPPLRPHARPPPPVRSMPPRAPEPSAASMCR